MPRDARDGHRPADEPTPRSGIWETAVKIDCPLGHAAAGTPCHDMPRSLCAARVAAVSRAPLTEPAPTYRQRRAQTHLTQSVAAATRRRM